MKHTNLGTGTTTKTIPTLLGTGRPVSLRPVPENVA